MTTILIWTGVIVLFLVADFALGVKVGRLLKRDEPDDGDEFVPPSWQPADDDLDDLREGRPRNTSPE